jgi:hypothetical protein
MAKQPPEKSIRKRIGVVLYVLITLVGVYAFFHQTKANVEEVNEDEQIKFKVTRAYNDPNPHPLLIARYWEGFSYVPLISMIEDSPHEKFWVVERWIDPAFVLNYYTYPKQLLMPESVQQALNFDTYTTHTELVSVQPEGWDGILYMDPPTLKILDKWSDEWAGFQ